MYIRHKNNNIFMMTYHLNVLFQTRDKYILLKDYVI
jgi:hypothetical protein